METTVPYILQVNTNKVQFLAIAFSVVLLGFIFNLIRQKKIKEEYSILWLGLGFIFMVFSIWRKGLDFISELMGVAYPPAALFLILIMAVFLILIQFSMIISKHSENNKNLSQEFALMKHELEIAKKEIKNLRSEVRDSQEIRVKIEKEFTS